MTVLLDDYLCPLPTSAVQAFVPYSDAHSSNEASDRLETGSPHAASEPWPSLDESQGDELSESDGLGTTGGNGGVKIRLYDELVYVGHNFKSDKALGGDQSPKLKQPMGYQRIDVKALLDGVETRTMILIKNIPRTYKYSMLVAEIDAFPELVDAYDYLYLPTSATYNRSYGFIHMKTPLLAAMLVARLEGYAWKFDHRAERPCLLYFAHEQKLSCYPPPSTFRYGDFAVASSDGSPSSHGGWKRALEDSSPRAPSDPRWWAQPSCTYDRRAQEINPNRLVDGDEHRTTLLMRGVPTYYDYDLLLSEIASEPGLKDCFNFIELPRKSGTDHNRGFAFIYLKNERLTAAFVEKFQGRMWKYCNPRGGKVCDLRFAYIQNLQTRLLMGLSSSHGAVDALAPPSANDGGDAVDSDHEEHEEFHHGWREPLPARGDCCVIDEGLGKQDVFDSFCHELDGGTNNSVRLSSHGA
ncbi:hypothetical protein FOZ60_015596 [Perkinsus olseni]|uniref:Mei2-like C-terminal RNA recognition motif domain-containing protein n=2 Tax=Perkinsus olseni TaxID=32597 RepID=A0A7J6N5K1_PEROL|nr:hypothetical protein FOZ60_015596 [Perkinsus olseni]